MSEQIRPEDLDLIPQNIPATTEHRTAVIASENAGNPELVKALLGQNTFGDTSNQTPSE
jgi:hypothetical protein